MDKEGELVRMLIQSGDPETLRRGLLGMGWPAAVADEQAASMRFGLNAGGIESQIMRMAKEFPRESPGQYETLLGVKFGRKPSPRQQLRHRYEGRNDRQGR
jgi:hypothetical protein